MAMRMTGMMSGMDTESIIQELVAARQKKVDVQKKAQTKLDWKAEAWKELNTKLKRLQTKYIANMRFTDAYVKKTTKVSNSNAVSVITGENAMNGVQTMKVTRLAKSGYLTGGKVTGTDGKEVTALSKLSDIGFSGGDGKFTVKSGDKSVDISVNGDTTISDVLNQIKDAGINANFDAKQQRFYVVASDSGKAGDFSFTASNAQGAEAMKLLGLQTKIGTDADKGYDTASWAEYSKYAAWYDAANGTLVAGNVDLDKAMKSDVDARVNAYFNQYKSLTASIKDTKDNIDKLNEKYKNQNLMGNPGESFEDLIKRYNQELETAQNTISNLDKDDPNYEQNLKNATEAADKIREKIADANAMHTYEENLKEYEKQLDGPDGVNKYITVTGTGEDMKAEDTGKIKNEVEARYLEKAQYASEYLTKINSMSEADKKNWEDSFAATKVSGQDAEITLNGATYTNNNNTFEINGLTITALTASDEEITVTTQQDTDGIYDMVKNFLKEYNEIVNEMDKLYNADRAKGYEPLTDDEKDTMTEKEIEKWETKVKDSLLRRDDNLSTVNSALQSIMASGFNVNGKTMYLYDFGIDTLGYFESADNEKHAYHIAGDPDDEYTSNNADKLKSMISNDPDTVVSFFSQLSRSLYDKMSDLSKSVEGYRSFGNFYDDKKMKSDYDSYTKKIAEMETKLNEYEDKWYKKFSKMETALAKMQSNMSAVTGLLGG